MNILLQGIVGSTAYGLAGPDSDIDRLGLYAAPTDAFHGLRLPIDKAATVCRSKPDITLHEARKYALLALGANPTISELMWLPDELYEVRTPLGEELLGLRSAFLSAGRVRDAYFGYATSQFRRLLNTGQFQSKMRKRQSKHARHLLRLLDQGLELYATGRLTIRVRNPQWYLKQGEHIAEDPERALAVLADAQSRFESLTSPLPERPDEAAVERWLRRVRAAHLEADDAA
jgi:predicted nucleotidyltransferase